MRRRPVRVQPWERDDADLFFADLMGTTPASTANRLWRAHRSVEEFFAELIEQAIEPAIVSAPVSQPVLHARPATMLVPPAAEYAYAEQPTVTAVALPPRIVTKWAGVDRRDIPKTAAGAADPPWMCTLIENSN